MKSAIFKLIVALLLTNGLLEAQTPSIACNGNTNTEIGGFSLCFEPNDAVLDLDRNAWFQSSAAPAGAMPSEAYTYNFPDIASVYPCVNGVDVEDVIVTITVTNMTINFPPALACCESYINGVHANLYANCNYGQICDVIGDGLTNISNPGSGDCSPSGDNLNYNPGSGTFPLGLPYTGTVTCLSSAFAENSVLGIDIFPNFIFEAAAAGGCNNCPQDAISQGYISIDFNVTYEYLFCSNDLDTDCRSLNFNPITDVCDTDGIVALPFTSLEGVAGSWTPSTFLDVSAAGGTTITAIFTPSPGECSTTPVSLEIEVEKCCSAEGGDLEPDDAQSICSSGGNFQDLRFNGELIPIVPDNISLENGYLFLLVDPNGIIIDSDNDINNINFPPNNSNMPIDYCIYGLSYKLYPGIGSIINGTTSINLNDANVLEDEDGNPLENAPNVNGACIDLADNCVTITVEAPTVAPTVDDISTCEGGDTEIVPSGNGTNFNFYDDPILANLLASGTTYDPNPNGGTTTEIWVTEGSGSCESAATMVTITLSDGADPGLNNSLELCTEDDPTLDLISSLEGTPESGGIWSDDDSSGVDLSDPTSVELSPLNSGTYNFTYTIPAADGCPEVSATLTIEIGNPVDAGMDTSLSFCNTTASSIDFTSSLDGTPNAGGVWSDDDNSGLNINNPADVDISNLAEGTYNFTYTITAVGSCNNSEAILTLSIESFIDPGMDGSASICEGGSTIVDLVDALNGNPDIGGIWSDENSSGVDLNDPTNVDFNGLSAGQYEFIYATMGTECPSASATITVNIGAPPSAGENGTLSICNDNEEIDLNSILGGSPDLGGSWSDDDASGVDISNPTTVDFSTVSAGDYTFTYAIPADGDCPAASAIIIITIEDAVDAGQNANLNYCIGNSSAIDFNSSLLGNPDGNGLWSDDDNSGVDLSDLSNVNFDNVSPGTYDFTYTVDGGLICPSSSAVLSIIVDAIPNVGMNNSINVCEGDAASLNFFNLLGAENNPNGTWSDDNASGLNLNDLNNIDPSSLIDGTYSFTYSILGSTDCPGGSSTLTMTIESSPNSGISNGPIRICESSMDIIDLFSIIDGEDPSGSWSETSNVPSTGTAFNTTGASFDPSNQIAGTYSFVYSLLGNAPCVSSDTEIQVIIDPVPIVDLGQDISQCVGDGIISLNAGNSGANYLWTISPNDGNNGATSQSINISDGPIQTTAQVNVEQNNCMASDEILINIYELPSFLETSKECSNDLSTYSVTISTSGDELTVSGGIVNDNMDGTFTISSIPTGMNVSINITNNATTCSDDFIVTAPDCGCPAINPPQGIDVSICEGESIPALSVTADVGLDVNWFSDASGSDLILQNSSNFTPSMAGTYYAQAIETSSNCVSTLIPIDLSINSLPTLLELTKECSSDLTMYTFTFQSDADDLTTNEGSLIDNMDGTFTISNIPSNAALIINARNSTTNCEDEFNFSAPDCDCPIINAPFGMNVSICTGDDFPEISISVDPGLEANWYSDANGSNLVLQNSVVYTPTMPGTYYVQAFDVNSSCLSTLTPIEVSIDPLPTLTEITKECSDDLSTYNYVFQSDGDLVTTNVGDLVDNLDGSFSINDVPASTDVSINITNSLTNCSDDFNINAPDCDCPTVTAPQGEDASYCEGDAIPTLTVNADLGVQVNWYNDANGNNLLLENSLDYTPTNAGTYYVQAIEISSSCVSTFTEINLSSNPLPNILEVSNECSNDLNTYAFTFESDADQVVNNAGILTDNMDGTFTVMEIPIGSDLNLNLTNSISSCTNSFMINPPNCECPTFGQAIFETFCDDNGTPENDQDDLFTYTIEIESIGLGNTFSIAGDDTQSALLYDNSQGPFGPFLILDGDLSINIIDDANTNCTLNQFLISPPVPCSTCEESAEAGPGFELDCDNPTYTLQGLGSGPGQFEWTGPNGFISSDNPNPIIDVPGLYTLTVFFDNGCVESDVVEIFSNQNTPTADAGATESITCIETQISIGGVNTSTGDQISYQWTGPNNYSSTELNPIVDQAGIYTLIVNDASNGCASESSMVEILDERNPPLALIIVDPKNNILDCINSIVQLSVDQNNSSNVIYNWELNGLMTEGPSLEANEAGIYNLTVLDTVTGCSEIDQLEILSNIDYPLFEIPNFNNLDCNNTNSEIEVIVAQNTMNIDYQWLDETGNVLENTALISIDDPGTYVFVASNTDNGCISRDTIIILEDITTPTVDAGDDTVLDCISLEANLNGSSSNLNSEIIWSPNQNISSSSDQLDVIVNAADWYYLMITDLENGCSSIDSVFVDVPDMPDGASIDVVQPDCFNAAGSITFTDVFGGTSPYLYTLEGGDLSSNNQFNNLDPSTYNLIVEDANGCLLDTTLFILENTDLELELGEDLEIVLGDSVLINPMINISSSEIDTIIWTTNNQISCSDCLTPWLSPSYTSTYSVQIIDENGCMDTDEITIRVDKDQNIYIPSVFSPNEDGKNDIFTIYAGENVSGIISLQVYNRWGEMVYLEKEFLPSDNIGWDGEYKEIKQAPDVYVYFAEIMFLDGSIKLYKGDVTLMR